MRKTVITGMGAACAITSFFVIKANLARWSEEPGQVIACIVCMLLLSAITMAITYFLTIKNNKNVQGSSRRPDRYDKKGRI